MLRAARKREGRECFHSRRSNQRRFDWNELAGRQTEVEVRAIAIIAIVRLVPIVRARLIWIVRHTRATAEERKRSHTREQPINLRPLDWLARLPSYNSNSNSFVGEPLSAAAAAAIVELVSCWHMRRASWGLATLARIWPLLRREQRRATNWNCDLDDDD